MLDPLPRSPGGGVSLDSTREVDDSVVGGGKPVSSNDIRVRGKAAYCTVIDR